MKYHFLRRGYPPDILDEAFTKAYNFSIEEAREIKDKDVEEDNQLFMITTHHPGDRTLQNIISKNWEVLKRSSTTKHLGETRVVFGSRRPKNLRDHLVSAKVPQAEYIKRDKPCCTDVNRCNTKQCRYCPLLDHSGRITSTSTGRTYKCKRNVSCKSMNLVYCITCKYCQKQYVGQTGGTLMDRSKAHFGMINRQDMKDDIGRHFNSAGHTGTSDLSLHILDFIYAPEKAGFGLDIILQVEYNWMQTLKTMLPMGLNTMEKPPNPNTVGTSGVALAVTRSENSNLQVPPKHRPSDGE